ncbi:MAG: hypothetical protein M3119_03305 [Verrucomicrobiota bacterium]|nr:hypothetical protein [Verrucomicrobiota bacterium]MDQ6939163.1 hypothetical protein [Verrucomicrobiota bacterium]
MNDFSELEAELKQLRPAAPSADLLARVERALHEVSSVPTAAVLPRRRVHPNWFVLGFGLAAATAFFMLARVNVDHTSPSKTPLTASAVPAASTLRPDGMTRVVYHSSDEGLVYSANFTEPARRLVSRSRETFQWKDPSNGASLRVSYPTEEVELVPVSLSVQ